MQKLLVMAAVLAASLFASGARADDTLATPFYVGLDLGHVSVSRGSISLTSSQNSGIDASGASWSLLGGYYFTDNFGVELGYHDYGKPGGFIQNGALLESCPQYFSCPQISAGTFEFLGKVEVVPQLDGILRLGVQEWNVGSPGAQLLNNKTSGSSLIYGLGVRYHYDYGLGLEITYEHSSFSTGETRIGISYSF